MLSHLQSFIKTIDTPLDVNLEIPHIAYCEAKKENPKILIFTKPIDKEAGITYTIPVVMNLFANHEATEAIFGAPLETIAAKLSKALKLKPPTTFTQKWETLKFLYNFRHMIPKKRSGHGSCHEIVYNDLSQLPILKTWDDDGGKFITMGQVYTQSLDGSVHNVGMYRLQVFDGKTLGLHWQIHKDSNHLFHQYKKAGVKMPVTIAIGGDPLLTWCATAPMPHGIFELLLYGFVKEEKLHLIKSLTNDIMVPEAVDFVIEGWVDPEKTMIEGMFGDHTGYYTLKEPYPFLEVSSITSRANPMFYATVVGKPPLEDKYMGYATERIFLPLLQTQSPDLIDYRMPENGVFHNLILAKIAPAYPGHSLQIMHALWGVGQMSFVKHALFVDETAPDLTDYDALTRHILNRFSPQNLLITKGVLDALDHSSPRPLVGGKLGLDATGDLCHDPLLTYDDDQSLLQRIVDLEPTVMDLITYYRDTPHPITLIRYNKTQNAFKVWEKISSLAPWRILIFVDHHDNDLNNPYMLVWRVTNNIDALRDIHIYDTCVVIDGTNKNDVDGFDREWPGDVVCNREVLENLKERGLIDLDDPMIKKYQLV